MALPANPNIFANNPLDRASYRRADKAWLDEQLKNPASLFVPFRRQKRRDWEPFVLPEAQPSEGKDIGWTPASLLPELAGDGITVFLGINKRGKALFAADVSGTKDVESHPALKGQGAFEDLRGLAMAGEITPTELAIMAQAKSMIDWHSRHGFCSVCGTPSEMAEAGYKRVCPSCKAEHFPRTDPVAIMLAVRSDRCLLGRGPHFVPGTYSCLAGFIEPGETIEAAVRRETLEESGIRLGRVVYHASQPWPFPYSLMIGCFGEALNEDITFDGRELEDCRWFAREEVQAMIAGEHPGGLKVPPQGAIASHLILAWAAA